MSHYVNNYLKDKNRYLVIPKHLSKHTEKSHSKKHSLKSKFSMKTSLDERLKNTDDLTEQHKLLKHNLLTKSTQQFNKHRNNLFKNTQIKKSIQLHKHHLDKEKCQVDSINHHGEKEQRDAYYGNTTTQHTKSYKRSNQSKLSSKSSKFSIKSPSKMRLKHKKQKNSKNSKLKTKRSKSKRKLKSPSKSKLKKRREEELQKKKQLKRMKKLQQQYILSLQDKLQQRQAEYNTLRTKNIFQQTKGLGTIADTLNDEQIKRLKKIHRTQEDIYEGEINRIKKQILCVVEKEKNEYFGLTASNYDECEDIISWIQNKMG